MSEFAGNISHSGIDLAIQCPLSVIALRLQFAEGFLQYPMFLCVGNSERIDNPSEEQVRHFLRYMQPDAPFVILNADDDHFMQATPAGDVYRVEVRKGKRQFFAHLPFDKAALLFESFRTDNIAYEQAASWHRLGMLNDPYNVNVWIMLALVFGTVGVLVWIMVR